MIEQILIAVQTELEKLKTSGELRYVAEDWGQIDDYNVSQGQLPCALVDFAEADYKSIGGGSQSADPVLIVVRIAQIQLQQSTNAPDANATFGSYGLVAGVNKVLHGLSSPDFNALCRVSCRKANREDVIKEIVLIYKTGFTDTSTAKTYSKPITPPTIEITT